VAHSKKNVFIVGLDEFNLKRLREVTGAANYEFLELLGHEDVQRRGEFPFVDVLERATRQLDEFRGSIDAIISYWDFPATSVIPLLCRRYGLPSASLESVIKCEHKYWSRIEQRKVIPDHVPRFEAVNPFDERAARQIGLDFPFWIKPVKAHSSQLGFRINDGRDLHQALARIRQNIWRFAQPFNDALEFLELPPEAEDVDGNYCVAEELVHGSQCTLEGYVLQGEPTVFGIVDSVRAKNHSSFLRYQYPSALPKRIQNAMADIACRAIRAIGYDNATFNIEFFWDSRHDKLWLLEINPRLSQSHSDIFAKVDGVTNLDTLVQVALGKVPAPRTRRGDFKVAAKCFLRYERDAHVDRVPSREEVEALEQSYPGVDISIVPKEGARLSELQNQDSYSYELALVHIGAQSQHEIIETYRACAERLSFALSDVEQRHAVA
jgi:biotin carboxylase